MCKRTILSGKRKGHVFLSSMQSFKLVIKSAQCTYLSRLLSLQLIQWQVLNFAPSSAVNCPVYPQCLGINSIMSGLSLQLGFVAYI